MKTEGLGRGIPLEIYIHGAGLAPDTHVLQDRPKKTWMPGSSPGKGNLFSGRSSDQLGRNVMSDAAAAHTANAAMRRYWKAGAGPPWVGRLGGQEARKGRGTAVLPQAAAIAARARVPRGR